ncbi:MAG: purine-nucleoside phosphorylase [Alphaproteobacteria bacterium]|nr:purine-nucleoside phosphorylase [Alphaproteobacteria bacterium]
MTLAQQKTADSGNDILHARDTVLKLLDGRKPSVAVILGSGLGGLGDKVEDAVSLPYAEIPGFPVPTVAGHAGALIAGKLGGTDVVMLKGRKHFYETNDPQPLINMIRTLKLAGIEKLFLSNAAGSLRPQIGVSQLMLITDHINYLGLNPLTGPNDDTFGPRFFSMTDAWDPALRATIKDVATENKITLHEGVYMAFRGPSFETPAEIRMAQTLGADAVGMSSVPECLIARHCGMLVAGVSCITNMGAGLSDEHLSHDHTMEMAAKGAANFETLVTAALGRL